jgi:hypothetical protein
MGPLGFVNWHSVNVRFRFLMWLIAIALASIVLAHLMPTSAGAARGWPSPAAQAQAFHAAHAPAAAP